MKTYFSLIIRLAICLFLVLLITPQLAIGQDLPSSSSNGAVGTVSNDKRILSGNVITFDDYALGTFITDQYANQGIIFGGDNPFITRDLANPTSPVLSGSPLFQGAIEGRFVDPLDGQTPVVVQAFQLDAGYFDALGSTRIEWFDPDGNKLGQRTNSIFGIETFYIEGGNIASWRISIIENEPAGFAIDNFSFEPTEASIIFRELIDGEKDGTWGLGQDDVPGFDHVGVQIQGQVYESHPGYPGGFILNSPVYGSVHTFYSEEGTEFVEITKINGVQTAHTKLTFIHDSQMPDFSPVSRYEEIPIALDFAISLQQLIEGEIVAGAKFQEMSFNGIQEMDATLLPAGQKGGDNTYTSVGLVEWAAESVGHNNGQGFIPNYFESISVSEVVSLTHDIELKEFSLLSPQLLNYAVKTNLDLNSMSQWFQGILDPVDFIITDPLGRRIGHTVALGELNEIPKAFYSGDGSVEQFLIPNPVPGFYQIEYVGLGSHVYGVLGTAFHSQSANFQLGQDEMWMETFLVESQIGSPGDVNSDGCIDSLDRDLMLSNLNSFTNDPNDPADIDGDGIIAQADVDLLDMLIDLAVPCAAHHAFLPLIVR